MRTVCSYDDGVPREPVEFARMLRTEVSSAMGRPNRYFVYIVMNRGGTTLYTGISRDIVRRASEHAGGYGSDFSRKYHTTRLVHFEEHTDVRDALLREKQIKAWRREKKETLIRSVNPRLKDLTDEAVRHMQES